MSTPNQTPASPLSDERVREIRNGFDDSPVVVELFGHIDALSARVAELERERDAAIADTREQAAKVCENRAETLPPIESNEARKCARAIRAKGFTARFRPLPPDMRSVVEVETDRITSLREFDAKYLPEVHARAEANGEYDAEGHKR